jgi:hypothetical protein
MNGFEQPSSNALRHLLQVPRGSFEGTIMHNTANPTNKRIGQLIRMLSSDHPGEAGAAAAALNRTLASAGLDIHALATVVETQLQLPLPAAKPRAPAQRWQPPPRQRQRQPTNTPRRPDGQPLRMDERIICDQPDGIFRACKCGCRLFTVMVGVGPHVAQLRCEACNLGGRWLSRHHFGLAS